MKTYHLSFSLQVLVYMKQDFFLLFFHLLILYYQIDLWCQLVVLKPYSCPDPGIIRLHDPVLVNEMLCREAACQLHLSSSTDDIAHTH